MKNFLILLAMLFVVSTAFAEVLSFNKNLGIIVGFSDSSFNYQNEVEAKSAFFCFTDDASTVCPEIATAAAAMNMNYAQGAHDKIELLSCEKVSDREVVASYILSDDYGSEYSVERSIQACR